MNWLLDWLIDWLSEWVTEGLTRLARHKNGHFGDVLPNQPPGYYRPTWVDLTAPERELGLDVRVDVQRVVMLFRRRHAQKRHLRIHQPRVVIANSHRPIWHRLHGRVASRLRRARVNGIIIGPILWGHSGPLCHALSLLLLLWTSIWAQAACDSSDTWWMAMKN